MTWIHALKRQGVVAMLSIGLAVPAIGLAGGALADSARGAAQKAAPAKADGQASGNAGANGRAGGKANGDSDAGGHGNAGGNGNGAKAQGTTNTEAAAAQNGGDGNGKASAPAASGAAASDSNNGNGNAKSVDSPAGCPNSFHNSDTGHGANVSGAYDSTCDGTPSANGNGNGNANGKPCAGCVGNADDKNPPGQKPNGTDHNAGYECDRNHGVGRTNPAHSGCTTDNPGEATCPNGSAMTDRNGDGKVNGADCDDTPGHHDTCPDGSAMTDTNGDGKVNGKDCHEDVPGHHDTCPDGSAMTDRNHDGKVNGADCHEDGPGHEFTCADGSVMTDHNGDGHVDDADCLGDVPGDTDVPVIHNGNPPEVLGLVVEAPGAGTPATPAVVEGAEATRKAASSLPFTGSNVLNLALIADLIMLVGTLAIWASGVRRSGHESQG